MSHPIYGIKLPPFALQQRDIYSTALLSRLVAITRLPRHYIYSIVYWLATSLPFQQHSDHLRGGPATVAIGTSRLGPSSHILSV